MCGAEAGRIPNVELPVILPQWSPWHYLYQQWFVTICAKCYLLGKLTRPRYPEFLLKLNHTGKVDCLCAWPLVSSPSRRWVDTSGPEVISLIMCLGCPVWLNFPGKQRYYYQAGHFHGLKIASQEPRAKASPLFWVRLILCYATCQHCGQERSRVWIRRWTTLFGANGISLKLIK